MSKSFCCETCRFFELTEVHNRQRYKGEDIEQGTCKRNSPIVVEGSDWGRWPIVLFNNGCWRYENILEKPSTNPMMDDE